MEQKQHLTGLSDQEVVTSRLKYGENILTPPKKESLWSQFIKKFEDPIIRILLVALLLSFGVSIYQYTTGMEDAGVFLEPAGIFLAVILATMVGFFFELSANKKFDVLNQVNDDTLVKVIRNSSIREIPRKDVVVGDIVILETGEEVPADGILIEAVSLQINESTLTGEPMIGKTVDEADFEKDATYPSNEVMKGTTVVDGHGIMRVIKVGDATEYGKVYEGSQIENKTKTPLNSQLDTLGRFITKASYTIAGLIIIVRMSLYFLHIETLDWIAMGSYLLNTAMIAVTVIVVAVPEGLPMSVTLSLALSMKRMLSTNNLVRKMHACETMGAASVICTDKTGTLTQNQMQVYHADFANLKGQELNDDKLCSLIKEGISVNSTAFLDESNPEKTTALGNPTEGALLLWLKNKGVNYLTLREAAPVIDQLTFSTERKYMATLVDSPSIGKKVLYVKGAPEYVLAHCKTVLTETGELPVEDCKDKIETELLRYQEQAMRTLGFAYQIIENDDIVLFKDGRLSDEVSLTFMGITAISDPVRPDVPDAIHQCLDAGINIKIVTGDTPGTATEIGRQIGLWKPEDTEYNRITGTEFAAMDDQSLLDRIMDLKIISRARPMDKERLVKLLQQKGQVVAVTGDGTNDAPALNAAQVGLSMGDGTTVAKEASAITILDNSFKSITRAVMWGRSLYQNIRRFILFQMTINVVACLIVLIGAFLGTESPLTVTQMLWVNLIMDTFAALALASLPPSPKVMKDKPRKITDFIINKPMAIRIIGTGFAFVILLFGLLQYFKHTDITTLADFSILDFFVNFFNFTDVPHGLSVYELSLFFTIFVMLQFWNMFNAKAFGDTKSAFSGLGHSKQFLSVALVIVIGQAIIVTFGGKMFNVTPIRFDDWIYIICGTSIVLWCGEIYRMIRRLLK
ncbi:calcium-translocating P-type ATPase, PMCA-type [Coprobacter tertius]|uniref:P-type Ca(2+) transporter n=1 Tax=Coprobacter tertius TaxID=2944915 RepID=A0ABT1MI51_9BACT|nr:calcium-translocating P-type ATPase, PMCA-type [Coprobacter tertius]MCP9612304.1 calcium-translocating P-type ATPase, PMCA-type [Coprobacter tertius]